MGNYECERCHHVFQRAGSEFVCPACAPHDEEDFKKIKEYLTNHQGASSTEVMRETGVSLAQIKRYLKEDRLEIIGDNKGFIKCEKCGIPINSGRFCGMCYKEENSIKAFGVKPTPPKDTKDSKAAAQFKYFSDKKKK